jgi:hypothetical protein
VKLLLERGADINSTDSAACPRIVMAARLFVSHSFHRIDAGGATGWNI